MATVLPKAVKVWMGANARIEPDGTVVLFEKDVYTAQELWHNSVTRIDLVSGVH
ncbi:hypothetical protein [Lactiplantibacillus plantarum]|uniref:hypothetical protein n=1 Tax=Lactiplantibacillus plantarum TaxID=1590 RepID=UPI0007BB8758|nr:hypothetical protein [Lactiplantibacillus plantarum]KZU45644.1 hypothetical protein Nizo2776_2836 [Lactiplantibacillus plantarum]MCG0575339.1 hypothetical protein [Lactiplantibacillus plantarum]MCG0732131.1 hypothetical protein [Lactiplantibacillus plantarum]